MQLMTFQTVTVYTSTYFISKQEIRIMFRNIFMARGLSWFFLSANSCIQSVIKHNFIQYVFDNFVTRLSKSQHLQEILNPCYYAYAAGRHQTLNCCLVWSSHACPCENLHLYMPGQPLWKTCHQAPVESHPALVWR